VLEGNTRFDFNLHLKRSSFDFSCRLNDTGGLCIWTVSYEQRRFGFMAIHSVNGGGTSALANMVAHQKAASTQVASSNDGDADDGSKAAATKAASPTVNLQGQELGKIVNTTA